MFARFVSNTAYYSTVGLILAKHTKNQNTGAKKENVLVVKHNKIHTNIA